MGVHRIGRKHGSVSAVIRRTPHFRLDEFMVRCVRRQSRLQEGQYFLVPRIAVLIRLGKPVVVFPGIIDESQIELFQVGLTRGRPSLLSRLIQSRKQQRRQNRNNGYNDEQFN